MSDYQSGNKKNPDNGWVIWAVIALLFVSGAWWLALPLLFAKLFAPDIKKKASSVPPLRQTAQTAARSAAAGAQAEPRARSAARQALHTPEAKSSTAMILAIAGGILAFLGLFGAIGPLSSLLGGEGGAYYINQLLQYLAVAVAGGGLLAGGLSMKRTMRRYPKYLAIIGSKDAMSLDTVARKLGYSRRRTEKDLQAMIDKGLFGDTAYLNRELGYFFRSGEADAELTALRAAAMKKAAQAGSPTPTGDPYADILTNIRSANDRIADPVLSEKIDRLEDITSRIFRAVQDDPKKRGKIDTFMNYYLPTTQKLLDSYAEFEAAGVNGENVGEGKARIESTMDAIIAGFERQLDELYKSDALDVDSDISVMETMLKRDSASAQRDFGLSPSDRGKAAQGQSAPRDVDLGGSAAQEK